MSWRSGFVMYSKLANERPIAVLSRASKNSLRFGVLKLRVILRLRVPGSGIKGIHSRPRLGELTALSVGYIFGHGDACEGRQEGFGVGGGAQR
ncbi:hypothetical protein BCU31_025375 [Vibrio lentus]|uniref:hypothetical protein n=1 Tax=Vibrio lentus TaxID=136468 RepID=UPI0039A711DC